MSTPMKKRTIRIENNSNEDGSGNEGVSDNEDIELYEGQEVSADFHALEFDIG